MKCPHCLESFHQRARQGLIYDTPGRNQCFDEEYGLYIIHWEICPACKRAILALQAEGKTLPGWTRLIYPKAISRAPIPPEVDEMFACDYREACLVLADSPKASAALSRRCLQNVLREKAKTKKKDLADQIDEVLPNLPSHVGGMIDAVRHLGNFAAHPIKSQHTGEIMDVEPCEAEVLLEALEALFDHYFVQPAKLAASRAAINKKLAEAGKPPLK